MHSFWTRFGFAASVRMVLRMIKSGHQGPSIVRVEFANASSPGFGFEALELAEVLLRVGARRFAQPRRAHFFQVMLFSSGTARQEVDFTVYDLKPETLVFIRPGQVQRLAVSVDCKGKLLLFEPSFISNSDQSAKMQSILPVTQATATIKNSIRNLCRDYSKANIDRTSRSILFHEAAILLLRLQHNSELTPANADRASDVFTLFRRFEELLESHFAEERSATKLARRLGCSEKTLSRACTAVAGLPPKAIIQQRVLLEAKRILAHTNRPVKEIAAELGFSEATNFVKFFSRAAGVLPMAFRTRAQTELAV